MDAVTKSNNLNLKYLSFTPSGCKYEGIRKIEFVAKTQFLKNNKSDKAKPSTNSVINIFIILSFVV